MSAGTGRRTALLTGASRGLGAMLGGFLLQEGFDLVATARNLEGLRAAAEAWPPTDARVTLEVGDVTDPAHRAALVRRISDAGGLDLLVNNASELGPSPLPPLGSYPLEDLRRVLEVNLLAPIALVQGLLPWLEVAHGRVVNISSDAALGGYPGWGGYGASKAGLDLASVTLAQELRERGVAVVSVDPGDMRTAMHQAAFPGQDISDRPLPSATLPFWAWVLHQNPEAISGRRFRAQADRWELAA